MKIQDFAAERLPNQRGFTPSTDVKNCGLQLFLYRHFRKQGEDRFARVAFNQGQVKECNQ
jgi:hypothetical protein